MKTSKKWSYAQITGVAEGKITDYMKKAREKEDYISKTMYASWAFGVFECWNWLTIGWQKEGDSERLQALIAIAEKVTS